MTEFQIISNFLREKCDESEETEKLCKQFAVKYMENEKRKLRAQSALEENIRLKLEVGNLESICQTIIQNVDAQAELHSLLKEYYEEHLKATFDIDDCEMEKLFSYEEIKIELETRDSVTMYQQFYWRKINMATKMEERKIVKRYRQMEKELLKSQDERFKLEESIKKLEEKSKEKKAKIKELLECICRLVNGSKELEIIYSRQKPHRYGSQNENQNRVDIGRLSGIIERDKASQQILQKGGFSSRISLNFNQFQTPFVSALPKIHTINPSMGLSRLLQQAEVLRKSMQRNVIPLTDNPIVPKLSSILKMPTEFPNPPETFHKTVSFEADMVQEIQVNDNIRETPSSIPQMTLDTTISEITVDSEEKKSCTKVEPKKAKVDILENITIKPAETRIPFQSPTQLPKEENHKLPTDTKKNNKRTIVEEDHSYAVDSPPKMIRSDPEKLDNSMEIGSKSFMDMFLDFSKEPSTASSSVAETNKKTIQDVEMKETKQKVKENVIIKGKTEDNKEGIKKARKPKAAFDDFEDFFSGLAGNNSDINDNDQCGADMSFDFFEGNDNADDDAGSDNFSFKF